MDLKIYSVMFIERIMILNEVSEAMIVHKMGISYVNCLPSYWFLFM